MRRIDAEALKKALKSNCKPEICHDYGTTWCEACCPHNDFEDLIDNAPTIKLTETEIQEALNKRCMTAVANEYLIALHGKWPQGEWEFDSEYTEFGNPYGTYKCSCCGGHSSDKYPYCFWCGAKMREGREDHENS